MSTITSCTACMQNTFNSAKPYLNTALTEGTALVTRVATNVLGTLGLGLIFGPSIGVAGGVVCGVTGYLSNKSIGLLNCEVNMSAIISYMFFLGLMSNGQGIAIAHIPEDATAAQNINDLFLKEETPTKEQILEASKAASPAFQKTAQAFLDFLFDTAIANKTAQPNSVLVTASKENLERFEKASKGSENFSKGVILAIPFLAITKIFLLIFAPIAVVPLTKWLIVGITGAVIAGAVQSLINSSK